MAELPTHTAFIVQPSRTDGKTSRWREVGAIWQHKNGQGGFDMVLFDQLSVSGRIVCMPRRDDAPEGAPPHE